ncbi:MAG: hypothetical protein M1829_004247 [Trizodia sp. TS-e1964]|nr:MAG: hypothetical protein M1829_004247 [Trizodia sp. TS-e1964]
MSLSPSSGRPTLEKWPPGTPPHPRSKDPAADTPNLTPQGKPTTEKSWAYLIAGGAGGMTAALVTSPLDVIKTRLQSDFYRTHLPPRAHASVLHASAHHLRETCQLLLAVPRAEGARALFKGLGPTLAGVVPASAIKFYSYGTAKALLARHLNGGREAAWVHLLAAAAAGVTVSTATNPIWLVKTRLQLDRERGRRYRSSLDCAVQVVRSEGVRGLYGGLSASYLGVLESALQWVLYEQMKLYLAHRAARRVGSGERSWWDGVVQGGGQVGAAGAAKLVAAVVTYPHEVVRTRLRQAPGEQGRVKYAGLVHCFRTVWRHEGLVGLYGGMTPHLLRVVPSSAIMFGVYEVVLRALDARGVR